jgi:hypothetical protein
MLPTAHPGGSEREEVTMPTLTRDRVELRVRADADTLYAVISDVPRTPEWSPQVARCSWVPPATGPAVGARFRATNAAGRHSWSNVPVVETAIPGRGVRLHPFRVVGRDIRWRYRLQPDDGGTLVTESYEVLRPVPRVSHLIVRLSGVRDLAADLRANMQASLARLAEIAEREARLRRLGRERPKVATPPSRAGPLRARTGRRRTAERQLHVHANVSSVFRRSSRETKTRLTRTFAVGRRRSSTG